jgi:hypothetical protein
MKATTDIIKLIQTVRDGVNINVRLMHTLQDAGAGTSRSLQWDINIAYSRVNRLYRVKVWMDHLS